MFIRALVGIGPAGAAQVVSLEEAYRSAMAESERIAIAREDLVQARREKDRAKSFLYPKVTADLNYLRRPVERASPFGVLLPESEERFSLTLDQPLYVGGRASATYRIAKLEIRGERFDLRRVTEAILFDIAEAYYEALKARQNVLIEEREVERLVEHRRDAEKRFRVGESTKTALLRAEAELANARARLIRALNQLAVQKDQLSMLAEIEGEFELADPPLIDLPERLEREWIELAYRRHPDLQRVLINVKVSEEQIDFARGFFYPSLSLEGRYSWIDQDPESPFFVRNDRSAVLKLTFPIFEGSLRVAELSQARSRARQTVLQAQLLKEEIAVQIRRALLNLSALTSELDYLKRQVAFAKEAFSLTARQFAVGLGTNIDVLDSSAALMDAERQLSNATYDRQLAILRLERAVGTFPASLQAPAEEPDSEAD